MRKANSRKHKKELGKSIDLRDTSILTREEFGHWELDTARGTKDNQDEVIISLLERNTQAYVTLRSPSAKAIDIKNPLFHHTIKPQNIVAKVRKEWNNRGA